MSNRGRKPSPEPAAHTDMLHRENLAADSAALTEVSQRSLEVSRRFGDGTPYDRARIVGQARFFMAASAEAMLELGKCLIQIKENEPYGDFTQIVTEQLGIGARSAQRMMNAAVKYLSPALAAKATTLSLLGKAKLFDLMDEADEDLAELAEGGTLAGIELDEMKTMSVRELRAALAEARKKLDAKDKVIQSKSAKLDKLEEEAATRRDATMEEAEAAQVEELRFLTLSAEECLLRLLASVDEVINAPATEAAEKCARHSLDYLVQRVVDGCMARGITVDLAERVSPIWAKPLEDAAAAPRRGRKGG
ncbi:DUF3102 domain-containing protein [Rubrivivax rivuli]|uniref:DUF3102 domain-containing protein n=1 Tax=Rubrivivax rivuli TaxID=1862385 RepID=A0A437RRU4_9BURK|nr:DUF3102 domain-containing protein [Rubrivivax rivuli]RVU49526.1 DUF3102 domain-containing protein [Rubrivivax rivuli]